MDSDSAEWILEAHTSTDCGGVCTLAPYCTFQEPSCFEDDTFSGDQFDGAELTLDAVSMEQGNLPAAGVSPFDFASDSFTVDYAGAYASGVRAGPLEHPMQYDAHTKVTGPFPAREL